MIERMINGCTCFANCASYLFFFYSVNIVTLLTKAGSLIDFSTYPFYTYMFRQGQKLTVVSGLELGHGTSSLARS